MPDQAEHPSLARALVAFQAELPTVHKAQTAHVPTKTGGSYSYSYADLADVTRAVMPIMVKHGLAFTSGPDVRDGHSVLAWRLMHVSGDEITGAYLMPTGLRTPQEIGSQITYGRRYAMVAALGIAPDDDDDGARAEAAAREQRREAATPGAASASGLRGRAQTASGQPAAGRAERPITEAQMTKLHAAFSGVGLTEREDKLNYANGVLEAHAIGRSVASSTELTTREAKLIIDALERDAEPPAPAEGDTDRG